MRNIFRIFTGDVKRISRNMIALVVVMGITLIPSLYAWFNVAANWDPYGKTGGLKVAVTSLDEGTSFEGMDFNFGDKIIDTLRGNDKIGWQFVDYDTSLEGVKSGDYYAAVIIPETFSSDLLSVVSGTIESPTIEYYVNEKKNAIAPKITNSGINTLGEQINSEFVSTVTEVLTTILNTTIEGLEETAESGESSLKDAFSQASEDLKLYSTNFGLVIDSLKLLNENLADAQDTISSLRTVIGDTSEFADSTQETVDSAQDTTESAAKRIDKKLSHISEKCDDLAEKLRLLNKNGAIDKVGNTTDDINDDIQTILADCSDALELLSDLSGDAQGLTSDGKKALNRTSYMLSGLNETLDAAVSALEATKEVLDDAIERVEKIQSGDYDLDDIEVVEKVKNILQNDPDSLKEFMASPVTIHTNSIYPIENYGSGMAPFYSVLAIWVGAIVMVAMFKVNVAEDEMLKNLGPHQCYFGRGLFFWLIGFLQTTIICLGDLYFLGIQCLNPLKFVVAGWVASFVFVSIIYTLTVSFGDVGKAVAVIIMVIQIAGAGGTFPIEVTPQFFQNMYPFLPFTYAIDAMRDAIAGVYKYDYLINLGKLCLFVPPMLLLGLLLRKPLIKVNEFFVEKLEDTKLM